MKVLVTGGAGFIGSHLVEALVGTGSDVRVLDSFLTGRREIIQPFEDKIELREADMADPDVARDACQDIEIIYHVGALPSVPLSVDRPFDTHYNGDHATLVLLNAARDAGVRRFIYSSSSSVYGGECPRPQYEDQPVSPQSPYAASKVCGETYVRSFAVSYGMETVSLRYFNVFGPRQPLKGAYSALFPAFIMGMLVGKQPVVFGDGKQTRDFTHVNNVVYANLLAAEFKGTLCGEVLNIAAGDQTSVLDVIALINAELGSDIAPRFEPIRKGDVRDSWADISRSKEMLGYWALVDIREGLRRTIPYYRDALGISPVL
jgi:UDP-glucose 4-epimerase